ncbi:MAG: hypothetical protein WCL60_11920 [Methylococcales bacterium]
MNEDQCDVLNNVMTKAVNYVITQTKPDDITARKMKNDIHSIMTYDRAHGAMALGFIAAVEGDYEESLKQNKLSITLDNDPALFINYAVSMRALGHNAEAYVIINQAMNLLTDITQAIDIFMAIAFNAGHFEKTQSVEDAFKRQEQTQLIKYLQPYFDDVNNVVEKAQLPFDTHVQIAEIIEKIRLNNHHGYTQHKLETLNNTLYHWSLVNGDAETIALMNTQLEDELSQLKYTVFDNYHIAFKAKEWPTPSLDPETPLESH